ncbi:hypothetical protein D3OALGA1CA_1987 [Olavius algarvensis associated proteobacterium Delta 3]|nr:hypothetical protein D3OALGA1CA_1987 [Olavius algarvensis associated proteobacterium Delta 3]CAB5119347.1 hypothetical protein D3OALGB2SA_2881 [Olavius algarvensis associated proteobacterium Delta 3]
MSFKKSSILVLASVFLMSFLVSSLGYSSGSNPWKFKKNTKKRIKALEQTVADHEERITTLEELPPGEPEPPGPTASVNVYDSSEPPQYLGVMLGSTSSTEGGVVEIFIPTIGKKIFIVPSTGGLVLNSHSNWYYESDDCSGVPYVAHHHVAMDTIIQQEREGYPSKYYFIESQLLRNQVTFYSEHKSSGECDYLSQGETRDRMAIVTGIAEADITFTIPVTLPLNYVLE